MTQESPTKYIIQVCIELTHSRGYMSYAYPCMLVINHNDQQVKPILHTLCGARGCTILWVLTHSWSCVIAIKINLNIPIFSKIPASFLKSKP